MFAALNIGDYTTEKLKSKFVVERKSAQDLYQSLLQQHVRFRKEIIRAKSKGIRMAIVVESTQRDFLAFKFPGGSLRKGDPNRIKKMINTMEERYPHITFIWCKDRKATASKVLQLLKNNENAQGRKK